NFGVKDHRWLDLLGPSRLAQPKQTSLMNLLRRKSVTQLQSDALTDHRLKRALGATNLTALGIGAIIGTGIFVLTGTVAAQNAGPAVGGTRHVDYAGRRNASRGDLQSTSCNHHRYRHAPACDWH